MVLFWRYRGGYHGKIDGAQVTSHMKDKLRSHKVARSQGHKDNKVILFLCLLVTLYLCALVTPVFALDLDQIKVYVLQGDYKAAITEGERMLAQNGHSDELYYIMGLSYLKDENYLRASDIFEIILKEFKDSPFKENAKLGLGDTYFLRGDFPKAQVYYNELLKDNASAKLKPRLYLRLSQIGFKTGDTQAGKGYLDKLNQEFPNNSESMPDKEICVLPKDPSDIFYSVQVGVFSSSVNANNLKDKLIQSGYPAFVEDTQLQGKPSFRVRVGKTRERSEAETLGGKLSQEGYPTKICP